MKEEKKGLHNRREVEFLMREVEFAHFCRLNDWAWYIKGARDMLLKLRDHFLCEEPHPNLDVVRRPREDKIYNKAILDLIMSSKDNISHFLLEEYEIKFTDHERDKKGKLVKCRAFFAKKVVKYEEVK